MKLMFGFRPKNRKRRPMRQRVDMIGERFIGLGRRLMPLVFLAAVAIGVPFGIFQAYLSTVSGTYFELSEITVTGLAHIEREPLLDKAGLRAGRNIFDIDLERADASIAAHPWVRAVEVERRLPNQVSVKVHEYTPVAILVGERYRLISEDGDIFDTIEPGASIEAFLNLPMISGLEMTRKRSNSNVSSSQPSTLSLVDKAVFLEAMEVSTLYEEMGFSEWEPLSEIHIDPTLGLSLVSAETGIEIRLGRGRYRQRLERLKVVKRSIVERAMEVDYILIDQESDLSRIAVGQRYGENLGLGGAEQEQR